MSSPLGPRASSDSESSRLGQCEEASTEWTASDQQFEFATDWAIAPPVEAPGRRRLLAAAD